MQIPEQVETSAAGKRNIENHQIPSSFMQLTHRLFCIKCSAENDSWKLVRKDSLQALVNHDVIVNNQDIHSIQFHATAELQECAM